MKRYTLLIIVAFALVAPMRSMAQEQAEIWFEQANAAYNVGSYDSAVILYEKVAGAELESVALYYNMGNAYYKTKDFPMAIYCYEKALKLDPSNDDVKTNLAIANMAVVDKIEPVPQSFIVKAWQGIRSWLSGDYWAWCSIAAFALLLWCLYLFLRGRSTGGRKFGFFMGIVLVVVFALSVTFAYQLKQQAEVRDQAIIMTPTVTVKSSPSDNSVDLFVLHEGSKISILESVDGWNKIKIANGSVGWLKADDMLPF